MTHNQSFAAYLPLFLVVNATVLCAAYLLREKLGVFGMVLMIFTVLAVNCALAFSLRLIDSGRKGQADVMLKDKEREARMTFKVDEDEK